MAETDPITPDEIFAMFGNTLPMEAVALMWDGPDEMTVGELRAKLREIAAQKKAAPTLLERLRSEAVNWSATCGDLFGEAADEIERLQTALANKARGS